MAHRGVCPDMACQRIVLELEKAPTKTAAFKVVAEEMGVPWQTIKWWDSRARRRESVETHRAPRVRSRSEEETLFASEAFKGAFEAMKTAIVDAKAENWKATSRQAALRYIDMLKDVVNVKQGA